MAAVSATRRNSMILVLLLLAQLLIMSRSVKERRDGSFLESWVMRITWPLVAVAEGIGGGVRGLSSGASDLMAAHGRNAELQDEVAQLRSDLRLHREAAFENVRLRRLLGMREELVPESIAATVVTSNLSRQTRMIVVDRGTRDGVRRDLPVVAWGGAVGRVVEAFEKHAKVRLLTDPNSGVAGIVQRSRAEGIAMGSGDERLDLLYVRRFSDVLHGDRVVTSGLDGIFPRGFGLGRVLSIDASPSGTQTIHLELELDPRSLEEVLILLEPVGGGLLELPGVRERS